MMSLVDSRKVGVLRSGTDETKLSRAATDIKYLGFGICHEHFSRADGDPHRGPVTGRKFSRFLGKNHIEFTIGRLSAASQGPKDCLGFIQGICKDRVIHFLPRVVVFPITFIILLGTILPEGQRAIQFLVV
jgi:hypothetical protein